MRVTQSLGPLQAVAESYGKATAAGSPGRSPAAGPHGCGASYRSSGNWKCGMTPRHWAVAQEFLPHGAGVGDGVDVRPARVLAAQALDAAVSCG